jgi:hypothetical protein
MSCISDKLETRRSIFISEQSHFLQIIHTLCNDPICSTFYNTFLVTSPYMLNLYMINLYAKPAISHPSEYETDVTIHLQWTKSWLAIGTFSFPLWFLVPKLLDIFNLHQLHKAKWPIQKRGIIWQCKTSQISFHLQQCKQGKKTTTYLPWSTKPDSISPSEYIRKNSTSQAKEEKWVTGGLMSRSRISSNDWDAA